MSTKRPPEPPKRDVAIRVLVTAEEHAQIKKQAVESKRSVSSLARLAITEWLTFCELQGRTGARRK